MDLLSYCLCFFLLFISETLSVFRHPKLAAEADVGEFPFIAGIMRRGNETVGTGNILSKHYVMTVCDKFRRSWDLEFRPEKNEIGYSSWRVLAGSSHLDVVDPGKGFQLRFVSSLKNHPRCKVGGKYGNVYDAAVIRVSMPFVFNQLVKPIPIQMDQAGFHTTVESMIKMEEKCTAAGWGVYRYREGEKFQINLKGHPIAGEKSSKLRKIEYQLKSSNSCVERVEKHEYFGWVFMKPPADKICGFAENNTGKLCDADEGAPLVCKGLLIGFFAQSAGCGTKWWDHPTIFTRLDMGLDPWLKLYIKENGGGRVINGKPLCALAIVFYWLWH